jgi:hypothetical protein
MNELFSQLSELLTNANASVRFNAERVVPSTLNDELYRTLLVGLSILEGGTPEVDGYFVSDGWLRLAQFVAAHPELYGRVADAKRDLDLWLPRGYLSDETFTSTIDYLCGGALLERARDGYRAAKSSDVICMAERARDAGLFLDERKVLAELVALRITKKLLELR